MDYGMEDMDGYGHEMGEGDMMDDYGEDGSQGHPDDEQDSLNFD